MLVMLVTYTELSGNYLASPNRVLQNGSLKEHVARLNSILHVQLSASPLWTYVSTVNTIVPNERDMNLGYSYPFCKPSLLQQVDFALGEGSIYR